MYTNLVPLYDTWFLSGAQHLFSKIDALPLIPKLMDNFSVVAVYRNNPTKLERARVLQKEEYERFVHHFNTDELFGSGVEVQNFERSYYKARAEELGYIDPPREMENKELDAEQDVGLVMDMREGIHYLFGYREFVDIFAQALTTEHAVAVVRSYLVEDSIPVFIFLRMRDRFPEHFSIVLRAALDPVDESNDPIKDFEQIMDYFKPGWRETYPSIHVANETLLKYYYSASNTHRNDPCPCGSGKKFKRCHSI